MVPKPTRFRHILLILLLLMLVAALPLSASAATTGTVTASASHVDEGHMLQLSTNMSGNVTWTSSSTATATVSSSGVVTGIKAGQVTVTASCPGYTDASITLWVTVPDGVYYLKNASSGLCMETVVDTAYVYTQNTSSTTRVSQLWKITHVSNGNYIIRPLGDTSLAMTTGQTGYVTVEKDAGASAGIYWQISHNAFGYAFKHGGSNAKTAMPTVNGPTGVPVYPSSWTSSLTCHWELEKIQGVFLRDTATMKTINSSTVKTVELDDGSLTLADLGLSWEYYGSLTGFSWTSSDESVATVSASGTVTYDGPGKSDITIYAYLSGTQYSASFTFMCIETVNLEVVYDYGYLQKYSNAVSRINNQLSQLQNFYLNEFCIRIVATSPQQFQSYADTCPKPYNQNCNCGACQNTTAYTNGSITFQNYHHKNYYNIYFRISSPTAPNTYKLAYIGHNICKSDGLLCTSDFSDGNPLYGVTFEGYNILMITHDIASSTEVVTVVHEFGHFFGAPDHYGGSAPSTADMENQYLGYDFNKNCIYGEDYRNAANTMTDLVICTGCRKLIQSSFEEN